MQMLTPVVLVARFAVCARLTCVPTKIYNYLLFRDYKMKRAKKKLCNLESR